MSSSKPPDGVAVGDISHDQIRKSIPKNADRNRCADQSAGDVQYGGGVENQVDRNHLKNDSKP